MISIFHGSPVLVGFSKENKTHIPNIILKLKNESILSKYKSAEVCQCVTSTMLLLSHFTSKFPTLPMNFDGFVKETDDECMMHVYIDEIGRIKMHIRSVEEADLLLQRSLHKKE